MRELTKALIVVPALLLGSIAGAPCALAQDEEPLRAETVVNIIQSAMPDVPAEAVKVEMIKNLKRRSKVNLTVQGRNAIAYLTWQKGPNGPRWWFEFDAERSLVFLSDTSETLSTEGPPPALETDSAREEKPRTVVLEVKPEQAETATPAREEEKADKEKARDEAEPQPVEKREETATGEESTPARRVPLAEAVGPRADTKEFFAAMLAVLKAGDEQHYPDFVLRPGELSVTTTDKGFAIALENWKAQCKEVHKQLTGHEKVEIIKITMQRPDSKDKERETMGRLRSVVPSLDEIYTLVTVELLLDNRPAYITIGGLMRIREGWRAGGRMRITKSQAVQIQ